MKKYFFLYYSKIFNPLNICSYQTLAPEVSSEWRPLELLLLQLPGLVQKLEEESWEAVPQAVQNIYRAMSLSFPGGPAQPACHIFGNTCSDGKKHDLCWPREAPL